MKHKQGTQSAAETAPGASVLPGPTERAAGRSAPYARNTCPECVQVFRPVHPRQLFCCPAHKAAFHNRATVRGKALTPMAMAARITRDGCQGDTVTGKRGRRESRQLIDQWAREDREAGRMDMVSYMRARLAIGY